MTGTIVDTTPFDTGHPLFEALRARQHRSVLGYFQRSTNWLLPEDLRALAASLLTEAARREQQR
jgi:hypothetical protein